MKLYRKLAAALALTTYSALSAFAGIHVSTTPSSGTFPLVGANGQCATVIYDPEDEEVVATAASILSDDIRLITGKNLSTSHNLSGVTMPVIAGTVGKSGLIDKLAADGKIDVDDIKGKWEAYALEIVEKPCKGVDRALVAFGGTPRGTAYALLEISRLAGVSPYVWWADVMPEPRKSLYVSGDRLAVGEPSVKFRGIFINDEDWGLFPWASKGIDAKYGNIGPNTYAKVMELLLRLRANVLWPAMHLCSQAFWDNKDNIPVAKKYDIALGSSHCEQMLRDNEWEWRRYEDKTGTYDNWNYVTNKEKIQRYWEERVAESKGVSAMYTLGMRGVHDWGISGYPSTEDKVRGLTEIIGYQRSLIAKHIGEPTQVPQIFIPYKEVLDAYNAGLDVPEDVILTWVDDNHGYIRQLPTEDEQQRSGGHGIYYHLSYWGTPSDYLWLCSTSPSLCSYELVKGYENGIRDLWVINVGDIKPAEAELEFCMDLAWDVDKWQPDDAWRYSRHWAAETFGEELADDISDIKLEYYDLAAAAKPEHIYSVRFSNDETDSRISRYRALVERVDEVSARVPERLQSAFFQTIEYPVKGACYINEKILCARKSRRFAKEGDEEKALAFATEAKVAYRRISEITEKYNNGISSGKWNGIMDANPRNQEAFNKPVTSLDIPVADIHDIVVNTDLAILPANGYSATRGAIKELKGLGCSGTSIAIWPMDTRDYTAGDAAAAPYVEYSVPVKAGENEIEVRVLPTFPLHSGGELNVGLSIDGGDIVTVSLRTVATEGKWNTNVLRGYNDATISHNAPSDGTATLRVYLLNPGIAISEIRSRAVVR